MVKRKRVTAEEDESATDSENALLSVFDNLEGSEGGEELSKDKESSTGESTPERPLAWKLL